MIKDFMCVNILSKKAKELIEFYGKVLELPIIKTDVDDSNGVYFGFSENAPALCIWDSLIWNSPTTGAQSFVFRCDNLDETIVWLKEKGLTLEEPVKYDWGTYELRLKDPDGNEVVLVEML